MKIPHPRIEENPALQSDSLRHYVARRMEGGSIDLHSAFQLHHEAVRIGRFAYRQAAWNRTAGISDFYTIFMHGLTGRALGCVDQARQAETWFVEDMPLLHEKRKHHFSERFSRGQALFYDKDFLVLLAEMRRKGKRLSDEMGPYHFEVFPWDDFAPEEELLKPGTNAGFDVTKSLDDDVESILVELLTGIWA